MKQNKHHKHAVFIHTLKVVYYTFIGGNFKMLPAAFLHDIGKPFIAYQKEEGVILDEYSFTDHEEKSYNIVENWFFISKYTKFLVRYHYLIRDIDKHKIKDHERYTNKKEIFDSLSIKEKEDHHIFLKYDDLGK